MLRLRSIIAVALGCIGTDKGATRASKPFLELSDCLAEAIRIAICIATTEESNLLTS